MSYSALNYIQVNLKKNKTNTFCYYGSNRVDGTQVVCKHDDGTLERERKRERETDSEFSLTQKATLGDAMFYKYYIINSNVQLPAGTFPLVDGTYREKE